MVTVVGISGSLRKGSFNSAMLRAAGALMPPDSELRIESIAGIPLYNGDDEAAHGVPEAVTRLKDAITAADGFFLATPEYNNGIPGVTKNAIDWLSRPPHDARLKGKPVAIVGAGGRLGSARAQYHLRQVCGCLSMLPVPRPEIFIASAWEKFDDGRLTDQAAVKQVEELLAALAEWTRLLQRAAHA